MAIRTIGILGAGAVGASIAAMILDAPATTGTPEVSLIADGRRALRLRDEGLVVNGKSYKPPVADEGPFDLVIVATKSLHLADAMPLVKRAAGSKGLVMSLLNGITSETILQAAIANGSARVIPAMIVGIDATRDQNGIGYLNRGTIHLGSDPERYPVAQESLGSVCEVFTASDLNYVVSDDIVRTLWWKFMVNVGTNQVSAITGGSYGLFHRSEHAMELMRAAMGEVIELSRLEGTGLNLTDIDAWVRTLMSLDPDGKTSMLQDIEAGRATEVDLFAGTVLELAAKYGLDVPVNKVFFSLIRLSETGPQSIKRSRA